jgi:hypothetical protein
MKTIKTIDIRFIYLESHLKTKARPIHPLARFLDTDKQVNSEVDKDQWQATAGQPENFRKTVVPSLESQGVSFHASCLSVEVWKEIV